ncbi:MAG: hypothetical protein H7Z75_06880 [Ferruginibacter sp.]|nr:hypothetical protein [Cytophagales bacterium]
MAKAQSCTVSRSTTGSGEQQTPSEYSYQGGQLREIRTESDGRSFRAVFTYNTQGRPDSVRLTPGKSYLKHVYAPDGRLQRIEAGGSYLPRRFTYNDQGRISRQEAWLNNQVFASMEYDYDQSDNPVTVKVLDKAGKPEYTVALKYDDKPNPARHTSALHNPLELLYGYPVGNAKNNLVEAVTTYHQKTAYKVNGKHLEAGTQDKALLEYTYNENGYPIGSKANGEQASWTYTCQ